MKARTFTVRVDERLDDDGRRDRLTLTISEDGRAGKLVDFATVEASSAQTAVEMLVPYLVTAIQPDPFEHLIRRAEERNATR